jgi:hypothetical protein
MPGGPSQNHHEEPETRCSISTPAPKPSWIASLHSQPILPHTAALAPSALKKLRRICQAEVRRFKARLSPATVKLYLSKYRDSIRQIDPNHLVLRPRKMRSGQRFSYLALDPRKPAPSMPLTTSASTGTNLT